MEQQITDQQILIKKSAQSKAKSAQKAKIMNSSGERTEVFIPDDSLVWVTGCILNELADNTFEVEITDSEYALNGKSAKRKTVSLKTNKQSLDAFPLQNEVVEQGIDDMTNLNYLHEASILDNLRRRFLHQKPYTYTGDICIAVNPYQWLDLYSPSLRDKYISTPKQDMIPHAYATSASAYKGLRDRGRNQSILVSGESGAGKTETVKILMGHLAQISGKEDDTIINKVLKANPLLESFGNAKTARNDNSSRFGKFTQLQFDRQTKLVGSKCVTYLLEKTRVVSQSDESERNYHVFHEVFAAPEAVKSSLRIAGRSCGDFLYTCSGDLRTDTIEGVTDGERYVATMRTLELIGVAGRLQAQVREIIAGIAYLGEVAFVGDADTSRVDPAVSEETIGHCCALLGLDPAALRERIVVRNIEAAGTTVTVSLTRDQAVDGRDALAKDTYTRLFLWLVNVINESTAASEADSGAGSGRVIGLLDIFGFESFRVNRFEQLCINYTNEKLQQKFTSDVLMSVQAEYRAEGLDWEAIEYRDNNDVLDLLESRLGFVALLNEECLLPKGSNANFLNKIASAFQKNPLFSLNVLTSKDEFCIRHYAGKVAYNVNGFLERNKDALPAEMRSLMLTSTNELVAHLFSPLSAGLMDTLETLAPPGSDLCASPMADGDGDDIDSSMDSSRTASRKQARRPVSRRDAVTAIRPQSFMKADTVLTKFKSQLGSLMESVSLTDVSYVRCIKPNSRKHKAEFDRPMVVEQLRCSGIIEAVKVSRAAYPYRIAHGEFLARFHCLKPTRWWTHHSNSHNTPSAAAVDQLLSRHALLDRSFAKERCRLLLEAYSSHYQQQQTGPKVMGGRDSTAESKPEKRPYELGLTKVFFSNGVLEVFERERSAVLSSQAATLQRLLRTRLLRKKYLHLLRCVVRVQTFYRCHSSRRFFRRLVAGAVRIQSRARAWQAALFTVRLRRTLRATRIQALVRMARHRSRYAAARRGAVLLSSVVRRVQQRRRFLALRDQAREDAKLTNQLEQLKRRLAQEQEQRALLESAMQKQRAEAELQQQRTSAAAQQQEQHTQQQLASDKERQLAAENEALRRKIEEMMASAAASAALAQSAPTVAPSTPFVVPATPPVATPPPSVTPCVVSESCSDQQQQPHSIVVSLSAAGSPPPHALNGAVQSPVSVTPSPVSSPPAAAVSIPVSSAAYPEDYERIKAELEAMRRLVDQVTHANTHQNRPADPAGNLSAGRSRGASHRSSFSPGTASTSPMYAGRRSVVQQQQQGMGSRHSIANGLSPLSATQSPSALVRSPNMVREAKVADKLRSTENELAAYKQRTAKLEAMNSRLLQNGAAAGHQAGHSKRSPEATSGMLSGVSPLRSSAVALFGGSGHESDDSDDTCGEGDGPEEEELALDLDNRNSDWQAYIGSFDDERAHDDEAAEVAARYYEPSDAQFDEEGNEILPPGVADALRRQSLDGTQSNGHIIEVVYSSVSEEHLTVCREALVDVSDDEEEEEDDDSEGGGAVGPRHFSPMRRSESKDSDDDSGAEDDPCPLDSAAVTAAEIPTAERRESVDQEEVDLYDTYPLECDGEDLAENNLAGSSAPERSSFGRDNQAASAPQRSSSSSFFDLTDVYDESAADGEEFGGIAMRSGSLRREAPAGLATTPSRTPSLSQRRRPTVESAVSAPGASSRHFSTPGSAERVGSFTSPEVRRRSRSDSTVAREVAAMESSTLLHEAVERGDADRICELLASYPKIARSVDQAGQTALHVACKLGSLETVRLLLDFNFNLDTCDAAGKSSLHMCRDAEIVRLLCVEGASVDQPDLSGLTPLHEYVLSENVECVRVAMAYGANPATREPVNLRCSLHLAADLGNYELLAALADESAGGAGLNYDQPDVDGFTPLQVAASCDRETGGQLKIFMLLLNHGASAVMSNERGISPLHLICANRSLSQQLLAEPIAELLLGLGADPNAQDVDGCTPLIVACAYREWGLCKLLLEAGGDLNVPCTMNSIFLQGHTRISFSKEKTDIKTVALMEKSDCTASDLMPKGPRYQLFGSISVAQTRIPGEMRDRCMNCAANFNGDGSAFSMFRISSGKHHCRHCLRVVCQDCSPSEMQRAQMPQFVQNTCSESSMRVCLVCSTVLKERTQIPEERAPAKRGSYWG